MGTYGRSDLMDNVRRPQAADGLEDIAAKYYAADARAAEMERTLFVDREHGKRAAPPPPPVSTTRR